jgi:hypothetical protein
MQKEWFNAVGTKLKVKTLHDWYQIRGKEIYKRGRGLLDKYVI